MPAAGRIALLPAVTTLWFAWYAFFPDREIFESPL
jgi:hypothetical protein